MRKKPKTNEEHARFYKCSVRTIERAKKEGAPLDDVDAMSVWFAARKNAPKTASGKAEQIADAKLEKVLEEIKRIRIKNDIDTKKVIPVDRACREVIRIGNAMRSELLRIGGDIPNWEGMKAAEMKRRWDELLERLCDDLNKELAAIYE